MPSSFFVYTTVDALPNWKNSWIDIYIYLHMYIVHIHIYFCIKRVMVMTAGDMPEVYPGERYEYCSSRETWHILANNLLSSSRRSSQ
jgi:hypothetical protein